MRWEHCCTFRRLPSYQRCVCVCVCVNVCESTERCSHRARTRTAALHHQGSICVCTARPD